MVDRVYYSLIGQCRRDGKWEILYGDYAYGVVRDEIDDTYADDPYYRRLKVVRTDGTQAAIDAHVAALNA